MLKTYSIVLDSEIIKGLKKIPGFNLSKRVRELLENEHDSQFKAIDDINIELKRLEFEKVKLEKSKILEEFNSLNRIITTYEQRVKKKQIEDLKQEKLIEDNNKKCAYCKGIIGKKAYTLEKKQYCRDCFLAGNKVKK